MKKDKIARTIAYIVMGILSAGIIFCLICWRVEVKKNSLQTITMDKITDKDESGKIETATTQTDMAIDENVSEKVELDQNDENTLGGLCLLSRDGDEAYFSPITEDYLYIVSVQDTGIDYGDGNLVDMERSELYSFDENGNVVQHVQREIDPYFLSSNFTPESYWDGGKPNYATIDGDTIYSDYYAEYGYVGGGRSFITQKGDVLLIVMAYENEYVGYYLSKPGVNLSVAPDETMEMSMDDFEILKVYSPLTDDFKLKKLNVTDYVMNMLGINDAEMESLICYDDNGDCVYYRYVYVMNSVDTAQRYYEAQIENFGEYSKRVSVSDNIIVFDYKVDESGNRIEWEHEVMQKYNEYLDYDCSYWSSPVLTENQFKSYAKYIGY